MSESARRKDGWTGWSLYNEMCDFGTHASLMLSICSAHAGPLQRSTIDSSLVGSVVSQLMQKHVFLILHFDIERVESPLCVSLITRALCQLESHSIHLSCIFLSASPLKPNVVFTRTGTMSKNPLYHLVFIDDPTSVENILQSNTYEGVVQREMAWRARYVTRIVFRNCRLRYRIFFYFQVQAVAWMCIRNVIGIREGYCKMNFFACSSSPKRTRWHC